MENEIKKTTEVLKNGGIILFPTDTFWSIGCDAGNETVVKQLLNLSQSKNLELVTCFVADDRMLSRYVKEIPFAAQNIIDVADTPTTIIYDAPRNLASNLISQDNTIAIRIPNHEFCFQLSRRLNGAIATCIAHIDKKSTPKSYKEIDASILKGVDYVVNLHREKTCNKPASIIQIKNNGIVKVLHK